MKYSMRILVVIGWFFLVIHAKQPHPGSEIIGWQSSPVFGDKHQCEAFAGDFVQLLDPHYQVWELVSGNEICFSDGAPDSITQTAQPKKP